MTRDGYGRAFACVGFVVTSALAAACGDRMAHNTPNSLFAQPTDVPSVSKTLSSARWSAAVDHARSTVSAAMVEQNLPRVSIAVGIGADILWAEGFGWRDVVTKTPVTPDTRFNIGTGASAVTPATATSLRLNGTGTESAAKWSPEAIGEPGEDFPPLTFIRHQVLQPIGLADAEYPWPGDRATVY